MRRLALAEAKDRLSELVAAAEAGEEIIITRHGKPAARLMPVTVDDADRRQQARAAWSRLMALREEMYAKYGPTSIEDLIAWKNEGRP